jgi:capsular exopolysaccharide synthesis family protein
MDRIAQALERARSEGESAATESWKPEMTRPLSDLPEKGGRQEPVFLDATTEPTTSGRSGIQYTQTRTLAANPESMRLHRVVTDAADERSVNAYRMLGTQVIQKMRERKWSTLAVTSAASSEGKTLTAVNLAISLGREVDSTVLLVDANIRAPEIHTFFGWSSLPGLSDYLTADVPLQNLLVHPGFGRLVVLPGGTALQKSSEWLGSQKMMQLVRELKARYPARLVVFDLPPVLSTADALACAPWVDAVLLVVEECATQQEELRSTVQMLDSTNIIGTVLNKSRQSVDPDNQKPVERARPAKRSFFSRFKRG